MTKKEIARWQANFVAGLAVVLPAVISIAVVVWLFGSVAKITDKLLFLVPPEMKYVNGVSGEIRWYWSMVALLLAILMISMIGRFARNYIGKKMIQMVDSVLLSIPLLNKIYGAIKQVNDALTTNKKSSFEQVVMVQFPREGVYSIGFITSEQNQEVQARTRERIVSVFVPTTPNPTTGFLIMVPEDKVTRLEMSVADGIKFIISLGAVSPYYGQGSSSVPVLPPDRKEELEKLAVSE